jgi:gas vesicle protein
MKNNNEGFENYKSTSTNRMAVLAGLIVGGLAGAGTMLLLAPQAGKETRAQIQQKTMELRDRTTQTMEDAVTQAKSKTQQITADVRGKAEELQQHGQEMIVEQLDRVSVAAEAGKAALKNSDTEKEKTTPKNF